MNLKVWVPAAALLLLAIAVAVESAVEHHGDDHKSRDDHHGKRDDKHDKRDDHHDKRDHDRHDHDDKHDDHHDKRRDNHRKDEENQVEVGDTPEAKAALEAEHDEEQEKLTHRLDSLTARLQHIDDELEKRLDPELKIKAQSLLHRLENLEESDCDEKIEYECGGFEPECISRLFVCDGHKDCHNGDDEAHCDLPTKEGDTFVGHVVFDHCSQRKPENMSFTVTAVKEEKAFTGFTKLRAEIHIKHEDDDAEGEVVLPTKGYYRFSSQNLVLLPPEDDRLGLICDFDGSDPDRCVGNIVHESSLEPCARFIFHREDYDDEHEHD